MQPQEYLDYLRDRYHTYGYFKFSLKGCNKSQFDEYSEQLLEEIFEDEKLYFDFSKSVNIVPPAIRKEYESVSYYSQRVLEFFTMFKTLKGF